MSGHTPGPWTVQGFQIYADKGTQYGYRLIDVVRGRSEDELRANYALIAAAPDLADSLIEVLAVFRNCIGQAAFAEFETGNPIIRDARAALAKAGV
jgi:hypothetical protein